MMRKIAANYIYPVTSEPLKNGIVILDDNDVIIDIVNNHGDLKELAHVEFFNGVIVPGFVNTHCHLELSHLKNKLPQHSGHESFIKNIISAINGLPPELDKIKHADNEMYNNGIVAVGDISNTTNTAKIKRESKIYYHTFLEEADFFNPNISKKVLNNAITKSKEFGNSSIVGHAPYSTSVEFIKRSAEISKDVYSMHNQEVSTEDLMYSQGKGEIYDLMKQRSLIHDFRPTGKSALRSYFDKIMRDDLNILLIHNIFTSEEDIMFAENLSKNIYWTLCPNSNKFIQNVNIDYHKFIKHNCKITLGTDSYASNTSLNLLDEMKNFYDVEFAKVLEWATINGAKALKIDKTFGSIELRKKPGLNLIEHFDFKNRKLKPESKIKRLL